ncbi:MFS transporter [Tumebacillus sp. ITR2]|uniref:MFS transporter n=1 Tax=Tumebacillus amylolyticus TaxID=2801339 RepID=A0ABS1J4W5_9BACL|nr:MFS transporter [Tumebacillus amylolyticus]MBL0385319.1 MFS transporter [Tumebacillus amylolyticus]
MQTEKNPVVARWVTVFATFLAFMGIGVVDPILPIIAEQIGATPTQVELLFTAYILTMAIMMIPAGLAASRFGDKRMMTIGLGVVTVFALLCGFSNGIPQLTLFRAGWGLGNSMFFATTMTLLIALTPKVHTAVGLYEAAIGLGMAGGPLVGGLLGGHSWRYPFIGTAVLIFFAFLLVIFFVYEPAAKVKRQVAGMSELVHLITHKPFLRVALSGMFYYYGFFVILAYSPLVLKMTAIQLGFVFFGWGLALAYGSAMLSHQLERKFKPQSILPVALLCFAIATGLLYFSTSMTFSIVLIVVSGLASGLNNALFTSHIMEVSPYERSITSGVYNFVRWLGAAIAPVLSGYIGHNVGATVPYAVAGVVVLVGTILIAARKRTPVQV